MDSVAVIIPVYNSHATLERAVDSVLAQTMPPIEVILVDDGSTDASGALCDSLAAQHPSVKVVHQPNAGLAEARRAGVNAATTRLVTFLDSDDTLAPDAIEFLYDKLNENDLDLAMGCFMRIPKKGKPYPIPHLREGILDGAQFLDSCLTLGSQNSSCCSLSKRALWLRDGVFPPHDSRLPSEDVITNVGLAFHIGRMGQWSKPIYNYYYTPQSLTAGRRLWQVERWSEFFALLHSRLQEHGVAARYERNLHILKIFTLSFCTVDVDPSHPWVDSVLGSHPAGLPLKTRLLQRLLRHPSLLRRLIALRRLF